MESSAASALILSLEHLQSRCLLNIQRDLLILVLRVSWLFVGYLLHGHIWRTSFGVGPCASSFWFGLPSLISFLQSIHRSSHVHRLWSSWLEDLSLMTTKSYWIQASSPVDLRASNLTYRHRQRRSLWIGWVHLQIRTLSGLRRKYRLKVPFVAFKLGIVTKIVWGYQSTFVSAGPLIWQRSTLYSPSRVSAPADGQAQIIFT